MADFDFTIDDLKSTTPTPFVTQQTKHQETPSPLETSRSRYFSGTDDKTNALTEPSTLSYGQILMNVPLYRDTTDSVSDNEYLQSTYLGTALAGSSKIKDDKGQGLGGFNLLVPQDVLGISQKMVSSQSAEERAGGGAATGAAGGGSGVIGPPGSIPFGPGTPTNIRGGLRTALATLAGAAAGLGIEGKYFIGTTTNHSTRTSTGGVSFHVSGQAADINAPGNNADTLMKVANFFLQYASRIAELFYTPLGFSIKNGQRVVPIAASDHYSHVHLAVIGDTFGGG